VQQTIGADNKVSDYPVDLSSMNGWYLNLASGDPASKLAAERILSPVIYNASADSVTLVTAIPQKSGCYNASLAGSHFINIRATTGGTPPKSSIVGPPGTGNQVTVMGTLGGLAPTSGPPGVVKYYTSSAVNPTAGSDSGSGKGKIDDKDVMTKDSILKRTSWVQLY
jgi:hypothetical protein